MSDLTNTRDSAAKEMQRIKDADECEIMEFDFDPLFDSVNNMIDELEAKDVAIRISDAYVKARGRRIDKLEKMLASVTFKLKGASEYLRDELPEETEQVDDLVKRAEELLQ